MKSLALLPLVVASVAAVDTGTLLGWTTPSPAPQVRPSPVQPLTQPSPGPINIIAPPTPAAPTSADSETRPLAVVEETTSAPTEPLPTDPRTTPPVQATVTPTPTVPPTLPPTAPPERAESTPEPAPTAYVPPPIPEPSANSTTFQLVEPSMCDETVVKTIEKIYSKSRKLFDTCAKDSAYQIFPYSGTRPTPTQIHALATSKSCSVLFAACANANLPECDVTGISLKAIIETLLKISMDVKHGLASPDTQRFHDMHIWRRNSNLAKVTGVPYGNDSALYAEYERELPEAIAEFSAQLQGNLSIADNETPTSNDDLPGAVHASSRATDGGTTSNVTVKVLSSARSHYAMASPTMAASLGMLVVTMAALVM